MSFSSQFALSISRARQLRGGTRVLYNCISWLMVIVGCVLVGALLVESRQAFGLPLTRASLDGLRLRFLGWIGVTLVSIPLLFYCAMVFVGGAVGVLMVVAGRLSLAEAKAFALYALPPARWLDRA